ncbi:MAG: hypothetical protein L3J34_02540 [Flavobacteriaceae bacterium]|nr:hypothetical protein [Flavobacteriaceae bacterium]
MKKIAIKAVLIFTLGLFLASCNEAKKEEAQEVKKEVEVQEEIVKEEVHEQSDAMAMATYQCEMKCEEDKTYDKLGKCPKCNMELKKAEASADDEKPTEEGGEEAHGDHEH